MDQRLPNGLIAAAGPEGPVRRREGTRTVRAGDARLPIVSLGSDGFVVEAGSGRQLRGYVDIMDGETPLDRRLVVRSWERDGLIGFEFKSASAAGRVGGGAVIDALPDDFRA